MFTKNINFKNFQLKKKKNFNLRQKLNILFSSKNEVLESLKQNYKNSYSKKHIKIYKRDSNFRIIGMGGSTLGAQAIYDFLKYKIKKNIVFIDNLQPNQKKKFKKEIY